MVFNLVRSEGVPALAYSPNDVSVPLQCTLKMLNSDTQFAVFLELSISINGIDGKQLFTLRYEGDNLIPGKTSLGNANISLPDRLLHIARQGQPQYQTLSLALKAPCSVWFPRSLGHRVSSLDTGSHELVTLAKARKIHILFDTKWLGKDNFARLQSTVKCSQQLVGFSVLPQFALLYQQVDWSIPNFVQDTKSETYVPVEDLASEALPSIEDAVGGAPPVEDVTHDAPPPYAQVTSKRPRDTRTSLTPDSPLPKRLLQDPTCAPSPTKRATSTASSTATVPVDLFQERVISAVEKVLPDLLRAQLPTLLQDLPGILVGPSPSPSLSPTPHSSQIVNAHTQHRRTSSPKPTLAALLKAAISKHTKIHVQRVFTGALDQAFEQATELHNSANVEFEEYVGDTRHEFATIKEDHVASLNEEFNGKLEEFKERLVEEKDELEEWVKEHIEGVVLQTLDRVNMVKNRVWCGCERLHCAEDEQSGLEQRRRAMSLPLSKSEGR